MTQEITKWVCTKCGRKATTLLPASAVNCKGPECVVAGVWMKPQAKGGE